MDTETNSKRPYLWVPWPDEVASLHDDLTLLAKNCREKQVDFNDLAFTVKEIETKGGLNIGRWREFLRMPSHL